MKTVLLACVALVACESPSPPPPPSFYRAHATKRLDVPELTAIGKLAFEDRSLSASGQMSCATCHSPARAFTPDAPFTVVTRAVPTLMYLATTPRFTEHFHDPDGDDGTDQGPAGGFTWDGRAPTAHDQARLPLFSPVEMANATEAELTARIAAAPWAARLNKTAGEASIDTLVLALEIYQQDAATFSPFSSKYDDVLRGTATLTPLEARGQAVFDDPARGNCASCHPDRAATGLPLFTDFGYEALEVPSTREDRGLGGALGKPEYDGMFKAPTLRNVARKHQLMHNGVFTSLRDAVAFYATGAPFGTKRTMSEDEIDAIVAFLRTLNDSDDAPR